MSQNKINGKAKAVQLLNDYPWLAEELKKMNDAFKVIDNPMTRMMFRNATISDLCTKFNVDESKALEYLNRMIEAHK